MPPVKPWGDYRPMSANPDFRLVSTPPTHGETYDGAVAMTSWSVVRWPYSQTVAKSLESHCLVYQRWLKQEGKSKTTQAKRQGTQRWIPR